MAARHPSFTSLRQFSSTAVRTGRPSASQLRHDHADIPPYPYEPARWYKQSNLGLYGGTRIQFGNKISERTEIKTRRHWRPNIQHKRLWSASLEEWLKIRVAPRVLRTIDKVGGLDEYLLGEKPARIKELGMGGWRLRWRIMQTDVVRERYRLEREKLGLPESEVNLAMDGSVVDEEELEDQSKRYDRDLEDREEILGHQGEERGENLSLGFTEEQPSSPRPRIEQ
ncbi:MAG: 39S ribosomal protein L24, mitochondrial [Candelina submexicana]|nr:MAG: 39S ribosomal protein L24, mitochondrial [Candelina submexicana]